MNRSVVRFVFVVGALVATSGGCSNVTRQPIVVDHVSDRANWIPWAKHRYGALGTVAQRRVVLVDVYGKTVCAEPSPDVADSIVSAFTAAMSGKTQEASIEAKIADSFATAARQLMLRSQGLQLYRDASFNLCQAYMNRIIKETDTQLYLGEMRRIFDQSARLIEKELPHLDKRAKDTCCQTLPLLPGDRTEEKDPSKEKDPEKNDGASKKD